MEKLGIEKLIREEIKNIIKEADVFGQPTAMPLSKITAGEMDIKEPFTNSISGLKKTKGDEDKEFSSTESKRWKKLAGIPK
jgi:hypothetical protein